MDALVTWHNDRLHRSKREIEAFIDFIDRGGVRVVVVGRRRPRPDDARGTFTAPFGAVARNEPEDCGRRVRRTTLELV